MVMYKPRTAMHFGLGLLGKRVAFRVFGLMNLINSGKAGPPSAHCPLGVRNPICFPSMLLKGHSGNHRYFVLFRSSRRVAGPVTQPHRCSSATGNHPWS